MVHAGYDLRIDTQQGTPKTFGGALFRLDPEGYDVAVTPRKPMMRIGTLCRTTNVAPENCSRLVVVLAVDSTKAPNSLTVRQITGAPFRAQGAVNVWCSPARLHAVLDDEPPLRPRIKTEVMAYHPTPEVQRMVKQGRP